MRVLLSITTLFFIFLPQYSFAQTLLSGGNLNLNQILTFVTTVGNYIFTAAIILVSIFLVWAGVLYLTAGSDSSKVKQAKDMLKVVLIGAVVIFGVGTIVATVRIIGTGQSDLFGSGGPPPPGGGSGFCVPDTSGSGVPYVCSNNSTIVCSGPGDDAPCGGGGSAQSYGCSCVNGFLSCVPQVGGTYDNSTCSGACPGTVDCSGGGFATFDCDSSGQCVQTTGGGFTTSTCNNYCASARTSCQSCTSDFYTWCLVDSRCVTSAPYCNDPGNAATQTSDCP